MSLFSRIADIFNPDRATGTAAGWSEFTRPDTSASEQFWADTDEESTAPHRGEEEAFDQEVSDLAAAMSVDEAREYLRRDADAHYGLDRGVDEAYVYAARQVA